MQCQLSCNAASRFHPDIASIRGPPEPEPTAAQLATVRHLLSLQPGLAIDERAVYLLAKHHYLEDSSIDTAPERELLGIGLDPGFVRALTASRKRRGTPEQRYLYALYRSMHGTTGRGLPEPADWQLDKVRRILLLQPGLVFDDQAVYVLAKHHYFDEYSILTAPEEELLCIGLELGFVEALTASKRRWPVEAQDGQQNLAPIECVVQ